MNKSIICMMENKEIDVSLLGNTLKIKVKDLNYFDDVLLDIKSMNDMSNKDIDLIDDFLEVSKKTQESLLKAKSIYSDILKNKEDPFLYMLKNTTTNKKEDRKWKTYVFKDISSNFIKIGRSEDPERRLKTLSLASGRDLCQIFIFDGDIESTMHNIFLDYRKNGEWFDIPMDIFCEKVEALKIKIQPDIFLD